MQGCLLVLAFDDGVSGVVDLSELVGRGVFALWGDQIDLCPDSLYLRATGKKPEDVFPALRHEFAYA